jgi:putative ABC transport system permease protein
LRRILVIAQVALALLLAGAGLLIKTFANLRATKPGFDPSHAAVVQLILPKAKYPEPEKHRQFFEQILPKLAALPGVEAAGGAFPMPFSGNDTGSTFSIAGQPPRPAGQELVASHLTITPDYFHAMHTPVLRGVRLMRVTPRILRRSWCKRRAGATLFSRRQRNRPASHSDSRRKQ